MNTSNQNIDFGFNPLPPLRAFTLLWLLLSALFLLATLGRNNVAPSERLRLWIQVGYAGVSALCLYIPQLEARLGRAYIPIVLVVLSVGAVATLLVPIDSGGREGVESMFDFIGSTTRVHVIWVVVVVMIGWLYSLRWVIVYSLLMGVAVSLSIFQVENLRQTALIEYVATTFFLMISFGLVGYLMTRLSAIENARREELTASNRQLASYANTVEQLTVSRERNRLARELHDTLAHTLSGLTVQMETIRRYWDVDNATARQLFEQSTTLAREGLDETRRALTALRASPLEELGLTMAITALAKSAESRANLQLELSLPDEQLSLPPDVEQTIYRIAQEALNNVVRHAQASTLTLHLKNGNHIELTIADNGQGFLPTSPSSTKRFGLVGMQERARLVNGTLTIESQPDVGTRVKLTI